MVEKKNLSDRTADKLRHYIKEKGLLSGEKLPNEYELMEILQAGRNTVREAVKILASRNILDIKQGAGTFIADNTGIIEDPLGFTFVQDRRKLVEDLMEFRLINEPKIASLAAQNATLEDIKELEIFILEIEEAIKNGEDFSKKDIAFHVHLAVCSKNNVLTNLIPIINRGVSLFAAEVSEQEYDQTIKSHRKIYEAIRDRRPLDAEQAMIYHLLYNKNRF